MAFTSFPYCEQDEETDGVAMSELHFGEDMVSEVRLAVACRMQLIRVCLGHVNGPHNRAI